MRACMITRDVKQAACQWLQKNPPRAERGERKENSNLQAANESVVALSALTVGWPHESEPVYLL